MKKKTEQIKLVTEMYRSGMTMEKIATLLHLSKPRIHQIIDDQLSNIKRNKRQMVEELLGFAVDEWSDEEVDRELFRLLKLPADK